jgi:hypothetical protein
MSHAWITDESDYLFILRLQDYTLAVDMHSVNWQCHIGEHDNALLWADYEPLTSAALERAWGRNSLGHSTIAECPEYTFGIGLFKGQEVFMEKNTETGMERQIRRIIIIMT